MNDGTRQGLALALVTALAVIAAPAAVAQQRAGGAEVFVTQAGAAPRAQAGASIPDPELPAGLRLRDGAFRLPPAAQRGGQGGSVSQASDGTGNTVLVDQSGSGNVASVAQHGAGNIAAIVQRGQGNQVSALQQGNRNVFGVELHGARNEFNIVQRGDDNQYSLAFSGNRLDHAVVQEGTGLSATQVGVAAAPFAIEQRGRGMDIRIEHNGIGH